MHKCVGMAANQYARWHIFKTASPTHEAYKLGHGSKVVGAALQKLLEVVDGAVIVLLRKQGEGCTGCAPMQHSRRKQCQQQKRGQASVRVYDSVRALTKGNSNVADMH